MRILFKKNITEADKISWSACGITVMMTAGLLVVQNLLHTWNIVLCN